MLSRSMLLLQLWGCVNVSYALHLAVNIHYPEKNSAVELCGFAFSIDVASTLDPTTSISHAKSKYVKKDMWNAYLKIKDSFLYTDVVLAIMAQPGGVKTIWKEQCIKKCNRLGPQGLLVNSGPLSKVGPLNISNVIDVWPDFGCQMWSSLDVSFFSAAIGSQVNALARLPGASQENALARPSEKLPAVMFRLNAEWYWDHPSSEYGSWHDLMANGEMEPVAVVEVYIQGVGWQDWNTQPIYSTEPLHKKCGRCSEELQFICDGWEATGYAIYATGNHSFGHAAPFFKELYHSVMGKLLARLPARSDTKALRVGAWGNCIGGLAAWSAVTTLPHLYNIAILGSPAVDYDCGDPFNALSNILLDTKPKIYIDSGADEPEQMNRQCLLLFNKLKGRGLVEGTDLFYTRAPFGTHQARMFLRRVLKALLVLFGAGSNNPSLYFTDLSYQYRDIVDFTPALLDLNAQRALHVPDRTTFSAKHATPEAFIAAMALSFVTGLGVMRLATKPRHVTSDGRARESLLETSNRFA